MHWVGGKPAAEQRRHQGEDSGFENALQLESSWENKSGFNASSALSGNLNSYNTSPAPKSKVLSSKKSQKSTL